MKKRFEDTDAFFDDADEITLPAELSYLPSKAMEAIYHQAKMIMGKMVDYKELRMMYACAIKEIKTKFEILNTEFNLKYNRNPISSIQTRLKSTASIIQKLAKKGNSIDINNIEESIHDIAGVRVVCSYVDDVFLVAEALLKQDDVILVTKKDYITNPKQNGYRSLHLIVKVPVFLSDQRLEMEVEVQIRTIAMDFWASLEHQLHYKADFEGKEELARELYQCAEAIRRTDDEMMQIRKKMESMAAAPSEDDILLERVKKIDMPIE